MRKEERWINWSFCKLDIFFAQSMRFNKNVVLTWFSGAGLEALKKNWSLIFHSIQILCISVEAVHGKSNGEKIACQKRFLHASSARDRRTLLHKIRKDQKKWDDDFRVRYELLCSPLTMNFGAESRFFFSNFCCLLRTALLQFSSFRHINTNLHRRMDTLQELLSEKSTKFTQKFTTKCLLKIFNTNEMIRVSFRPKDTLIGAKQIERSGQIFDTRTECSDIFFYCLFLIKDDYVASLWFSHCSPCIWSFFAS